MDHYQLRRVIDVYVAPSSTDLGGLANRVDKVISGTHIPEGVRVTMRGSVEGMRQSFKSFGIGLVLAIVLVYLILMAQFASFIDPFIILLAIPPGITGVLVFLLITGTTLNVMSLMGVIMMTGIVVSNSILIVEFTRTYRKQGMPIAEAVALACRVRLRPVLMTSLATILGMIPMALALEAGSEQYAPLARAIIGGLTMSVIVTVFVVPAAYLWSIARKSSRVRRCKLETQDPWACPLLHRHSGGHGCRAEPACSIVCAAGDIAVPLCARSNASPESCAKCCPANSRGNPTDSSDGARCRGRSFTQQSADLGVSAIGLGLAAGYP